MAWPFYTSKRQLTKRIPLILKLSLIASQTPFSLTPQCSWIDEISSLKSQSKTEEEKNYWETSFLLQSDEQKITLNMTISVIWPPSVCSPTGSHLAAEQSESPGEISNLSQSSLRMESHQAYCRVTTRPRFTFLYSGHLSVLAIFLGSQSNQSTNQRPLNSQKKEATPSNCPSKQQKTWWHFHFERRTKNDTEGFSFPFNWLWQEFH